MINSTANGPKTDNLTYSKSQFSTFTATVGLIVSLIIITANFVVLFVFLKSKSVRENLYLNLVICLSIYDLSTGLSGLLASLRLLIPGWSGLYVPCFLSVILFTVDVYMSLFQTFLISFHRFLVAIGSPLNDHLLKGKRKYIIYIVSWTTVLALNLTFAIISVNERSEVCNIKVLFGKHVQNFLGGYGTTNLFLLISTIVLYSFTLHNVRKRYTRTFAWQTENSQVSDERVRATDIGTKKVFESLKVVGIIISLLLFLTGPFIVVMFSFIIGFNPSHATLFIVSTLAGMNSAINPFIYSLKIESLRKELKLLFKCFCPKIFRT